MSSSAFARRVALATCSSLASWEVDDAPLFAAFAACGVDAVATVWDDPDVDWAGFDACLIRTTWDYTSKCDAFVAWAQRVERMTQLFNAAAIVRWNTNKCYLRDLQARGVAIVPTVWLRRGSQAIARAILAEHNWPAGFIKPVIGSTARETLRFATDDASLAAAQQHLDRLLAHEDLMMQPYLRSVETAGEFSAIFIDGSISHGVRKIPMPGDYRVQDDFGATDEPYNFSSAELTLAARAVQNVGQELLYARADFLRSDDGDLLLTELELVEPSLFFRHNPSAAVRLAQAVCSRLR